MSVCFSVHKWKKAFPLPGVGVQISVCAELNVARNVLMFSFSLFTALCTFAGKHVLSKHNQKALKTDYFSVTLEMESSPSCRIVCLIAPNQ